METILISRCRNFSGCCNCAYWASSRLVQATGQQVITGVLCILIFFNEWSIDAFQRWQTLSVWKVGLHCPPMCISPSCYYVLITAAPRRLNNLIKVRFTLLVRGHWTRWGYVPCTSLCYCCRQDWFRLRIAMSMEHQRRKMSSLIFSGKEIKCAEETKRRRFDVHWWPHRSCLLTNAY